MDVPAFPGDGVYRSHWCPEPWTSHEQDVNAAEAEEG